MNRITFYASLFLLGLNLAEPETCQEVECKGVTELRDGTKEMVQMLQTISKEVHGHNGLYALPSKESQAFLGKIKAAKKPGVRMGLSEQLGLSYLRSGEVDLALAEFGKIQEFLKTIEAPEYARIALADDLATGYLRKAENDNCLALHSPDSCLMPLKGGGVHQRKEAAQAAIPYLLETLKLNPKSRAARWLLALSHMALGTYPEGVPEAFRLDPDLFKSKVAFPRYPNVASQLGIDCLGMAGGVVLEDLDLDGHVDILASGWGLEEQLIYMHNDGQGGFEDRTQAAGLMGICGGLNMTHADYDNDGDADILILRGAWKTFPEGHPNSLLRNNGNGSFSDVTVAAGILSRHPTQVGQWADYDNDGWLDIFIGNESVGATEHPCKLFHNNQDGTFSNVAPELNLNIVGFVKGATWGDFDNDGDMDLYVSRFGEPNQLFKNEGTGNERRFLDVTQEFNVSQPERSFPTWFFDYNNDGLLDLFVAPFPGFNADSLEGIVRDYLGEPHELPTARLYQGQPGGGFQEVSEAAGIQDAMLAMGANYEDIDNDGFLDIFIGTGEPRLHTLVPNRMYHNQAGKGFENVTFSGGFGHLQKGHGIAMGDLDDDGDMDVYAVMGGAYIGDTAYNAYFQNPGNDNTWVKLKLVGRTCNRSAIGAVIRIQVNSNDAPRTIYRSVGTGGSFGSSTLLQEVGLGAPGLLDEIAVRWPGSTAYEPIEGVLPGATYVIEQGMKQAYLSTPSSFHAPSSSD